MTPAAETPMTEAQSFNVAPIPASESLGNPIKLARGEPVPDASTLTRNTVDSTVSHDKYDKEPEAQAFGVAPLPATAGLGNPIHLAPGEKVPDPSTFTSNTVNNTAKTDSSSYAKADALPALPDLGLTPQAERDAKGGMFGLPPVMGTMIPESSLPMGVDAKVEQDTGVAIQSAAPTSTTAELAGQVPKEPRGVPEIVSESRKEAGFAPEATSNPIAVLEKKEVESELKEEVPEAPAAADNSYLSQAKSNAGVAAASIAAAATAGAGLFTAAAYNAKEKAAEASGLDKSATTTETATQAAYNAKDRAAEATGLDSSATATETATQAAYNAKDKAAETATSLNNSTSGNQTVTENVSAAAYNAKDKVAEATGLNGSATVKDVPSVVSESQRAAHVGPEASANAEAVDEKRQMEQELLSSLPKTNEHGASAPAIAVPDVVSESQREAHASPEAAANSEAVAEKKAVESELLRSLPKTNEAGEPAPVITAATSTTAPGASSAKTEPAPSVPDVVAESQKAAHVSPEAAADIEIVGEKKAVEAQLLEEVKKVTSTGEPAPVAAVGSSNTAALSDEALVDSKPLKSSSEPDALNAPASAPALPPTATTTTKAVEPTPFIPVEKTTSSSKPIDANTSVSFAPKEPATTEQTKPAVTTGTETTAVDSKSGAPAATAEASSSLAPETPKKDLRKDSDVSPKGTPGSQSIASGADDKKKKRRSIFGKIKDKLSSKH